MISTGKEIYAVTGSGRPACGCSLRARLSQSDLCRRLQLAGVIVERDVISRIENGGRFVADFEVVVIADVLEVSVDWLLGKE